MKAEYKSAPEKIEQNNEPSLAIYVVSIVTISKMPIDYHSN